MLQIRNDLNIIREVESCLSEAIFAQINNNGYKFFVVLTYNPPRYNKQTILEDMGVFLDGIDDENMPIILCGDINIDIRANNCLANDYKNLIKSYGFVLLSKESTRVTFETSTCIDNLQYDR